MNKTELESKHIAELHALAAEADVPRYRMLPRAELIEKLSDGNGSGRSASTKPPRDRERSSRSRGERGGRDRRPRERAPRKEPKPPAVAKEEEAPPEAPPQPTPAAPPALAAAEGESSRPKRKRRRRRFGRRSKSLRPQDLLTPPPGRQSLVYGESREACTALLREIAADLAEGSIALLVDPSPEELADWKREAPEAELVVAAQARHASDALAQAQRRAEGGEDVILLVDSLTRLDDGVTAKEIFDGGLGLSSASGSLTVVAALERQQ